jgi:hypothetical protein
MSAGLYGSVGGVTRNVKKLYANVNGVTREIKGVYANVNGVVRKVYSGAVEWTYTLWRNLTNWWLSVGNAGDSCGLVLSNSDGTGITLEGQVVYTFAEPLSAKVGDSIKLALSVDRSGGWLQEYSSYVRTSSHGLTNLIAIDESDTELIKTYNFTSNETVSNITVGVLMKVGYINSDDSSVSVKATATINIDDRSFILNSSGTSENQ